MANQGYYHGAGIMALYCAPDLINNTIIRNHQTSGSASASGAGLYTYLTDPLVCCNNIIYDNSAPASPNIDGTVSVSYSCIEGGYAGTGNISSNPLLLNVPLSAYCLLSQIDAGQSITSPCVDAGDPGSMMIEGTTRTDWVPDAGIVDMGFHWIDALTGAFNELDLTSATDRPHVNDTQSGNTCTLQLVNHPNPFNPTTKLQYTLTQGGWVRLTIYDITGSLVSTLTDGYLEPGVHQSIFDASGLPSGVYIYCLKTGQNITTGKVLLAK